MIAVSIILICVGNALDSPVLKLHGTFLWILSTVLLAIYVCLFRCFDLETIDDGNNNQPPGGRGGGGPNPGGQVSSLF